MKARAIWYDTDSPKFSTSVDDLVKVFSSLHELGMGDAEVWICSSEGEFTPLAQIEFNRRCEVVAILSGDIENDKWPDFEEKW